MAVLAVTAVHAWPELLRGGFVGVDIFFVLSGYLITGQLARELARTGRIALPAFWAKRARRLLPASILVLVFATIMTLVVLPLSSLTTSLREILASILYVENYLASSDESLVQHYWSLSLEEQFYILWPLLLLAATWLAGRMRRANVLIGVVSAATILSFIFSVVYTATNPSEAYFSTFTRMWEFGVGAVLALLPSLRPRSATVSNLLGYSGFAVVLACGYLFNSSTPFPGYMAAIPVLATAAIIVSASRANRFDAARVLGVRPMRFIGDISYSVYLWHWPLIVIARTTARGSE